MRATRHTDQDAFEAGTRLTRLDGLRGLAACGVAFLYHPLLEFDPGVMDQAPGAALWLRSWGWTFVDLFFLISGYIFAHVYLLGNRLDRSAMKDFAVARIARLYPLHLLTLIVCAVMLGDESVNTWQAVVAHLFMMQAFAGSAMHTFNGPSWSISVELVCYALFVLGAVRGDRTLRIVTVAAILVALTHFIVQNRPGAPWAGDGVPRGLLSFFLGQALWRWRTELARVPVVLLVVLLVAGLCIDVGGPSRLLAISFLSWTSALLLAMRMPFMGGRVFAWLGDRSYAVYLIHFPILKLVIPFLETVRTGWQSAAITLAYAAIVLALSDVTYRCFEIPARRAIRAGWERRSTAKSVRGASPA